ncbi:2,4-dichlorophenol 6-monooxygenase [Pleomassaria siparia CBS 279.74]|uniref:2,4-dichlorophenol 6-monooxygenase n=1 Tax=Pleomassaria siparia CBS 279.74 TaxID=1314801 RepID=A0A6G1JWN8_9PLEO|nr:2,4-dichlorophenol 6-monooxygenase [Pleomassaria siparia CBS 279.74]
MGSITTQEPLATNGTSTVPTQAPIETDLLIIGAGPAGASLACFLARYGLSGIVVSAAPGTADTPRAHINNMAALECLRDIGLWEQCKKLGNAGNTIENYRWCETMAGEEYARNPSWGAGPRRGEYETVSPCYHMDLPQNLLEPILVKYATQHGFKVRFDTQLLSFTSDEKTGKSDCLVRDRVTGLEYHILTRFLFGADGARSIVMKTLDLPMTVFPSGGTAWNVLIKADLSHIMPFRDGNLHWCMQLEKDSSYLPVCRMVKPWTEWMIVWLPKGPHVPPEGKSNEEWITMVQDLIGDEDVDVEILRVDKWVINETSADVLSRGNVFCLGDSIHRHPPTLGLGSNTCIQDSYNLAWKVNLVLKDLAHPSLLDTYNTERQPVGAKLVTKSNDMLRIHVGIWEAIGSMPPGTPERERLAGLKELRSNTAAGKERRKRLKESLEDIKHEVQALGIEMNQLYTGPGIYAHDEEGAYELQGREVEDADLYHTPNTFPGRRLPHVWLNTALPGPLVSTLDVAGKGHFTLFTGIGGDAWRDAAWSVYEKFDVDIKVVGIGRGLEWEDVYMDWETKKGVDEEGCVLVRPDRFVAWRAKDGGREGERLTRVMMAVLGLSPHVSV